MLQELSDWLAQTYLFSLFSDTTRLETWLIIPVSQSIHIAAVAMIAISVGLLNLRLVGLAGTRQSFLRLSAQLLPWIWGALAVLFITGVVQTIAEPSRELMNSTFRIKMILLAISIAITVFYRVQVKKNPTYWDERQGLARLLAGTSLVFWLCIIAAGRLIAYYGALQS